MKVFHPTVEEFRHPMRYFRRWVQQCASRRRICYNHFGGCSIEAEARNYGVVKVVPPKGWNPPVAMSPQSELGRRFETKRQAVNRLQVGGPGVRACTTDLHDTHTHTHRRVSPSLLGKNTHCASTTKWLTAWCDPSALLPGGWHTVGGQHSQPSEADFHSLPTTVYAILPTTMCSNGLASRSRWRALSCQVRGVASIPSRCGVTNPSRATVVQRSHLPQRQQARRPTHRLQVAPSCYMPSSQSTGASSRQHRTLFRCIDAAARGCCTVP